MRSLIRWLFVAALLAPTVALMRPQPTHASEDWCFDDPVVVVGARSLRINLGVQGTAAEVSRAVSAANIVIYVPQGVPAFLSVGANFYFRENVQFVPVPGGSLPGGVLGGIIGQPIHVHVVVTWNATQILPAQMNVTELLTLQLAQLLTTSATPGTTSSQFSVDVSLY